MAIFLTTVVVILVSGNILQRTYHKQALQNKISQVQSQCNILASQIQLNEFNINSNTNNLDIEIDQLANVLEGRLIVVNADYRIIKDTYTIEQNKYMISMMFIISCRAKTPAIARSKKETNMQRLWCRSLIHLL